MKLRFCMCLLKLDFSDSINFVGSVAFFIFHYICGSGTRYVYMITVGNL